MKHGEMIYGETKRGEVWWIDFDPSVGGEIRKQCPAIIVSNDAANRHLNRVQVVPLTSKIGRLYPSEAAVVVDGKQGKALADQLTTVSKQRMMNRAGSISTDEMRQVEQAIRYNWTCAQGEGDVLRCHYRKAPASASLNHALLDDRKVARNSSSLTSSAMVDTMAPASARSSLACCPSSNAR
jgi:mRNA interferase MazF